VERRRNGGEGEVGEGGDVVKNMVVSRHFPKAYGVEAILKGFPPPPNLWKRGRVRADVRRMVSQCAHREREKEKEAENHERCTR
jgi:hypothetical protein